MSKKLITLTIIMISCLMVLFSGCNKNQPDANENNSYLISYYKVNRVQNDDGTIEEKGIDLIETKYLLKSQVIKLDDYGKSKVYSCYYTGQYGDNYYYKPSDDTTIIVTERQKKTIRFFVNGVDLSTKFNEEELEIYNENFVDTYNEEFNISSYNKNSLINAIYRIYGWAREIELYTKDASEPFVVAENSSSYGNYMNFSFSLIKSTDVYITLKTL